MQNKTEWKKEERERFGCVSITASTHISSCDLILTGSCQRYDRVITVLTPPSAASSAHQKTMMHSLVQQQSVINTIISLNMNLKMTDDNLGMCWQQHNLRWGFHHHIVHSGLVVRVVKSLWCADSQENFKGLVKFKAKRKKLKKKNRCLLCLISWCC